MLPLSPLVRHNGVKMIILSRNVSLEARLLTFIYTGRRNVYGFGRRTNQWAKGVHDWKVKDERKHDARNQARTRALGRQTKVEALRTRLPLFGKLF
jgi:hypothetical protein